MEDIYKVLHDLGFEVKKVLDLVRKNGPLTKSNLSLLANMKLTTLNRIMEPLEAMGLVIQSCIGESTGGRKPVLYDINAGKGYIAGVDISRTYTQVVITNLKMEILFKQQFGMNASYTPDKTIGSIIEVIQKALKELKIEDGKLMGIGIGTIGPLDREKGIMINPVNFEAQGWRGVHIKEMLQDKMKCQVFVDNGANAAVLAEMLFGKGKGFKNLVYFNCGVGIRTGAISSETIIRTVNDAEDAFGHMVIDVDGEACSCGNYGCIECYSSIYSITRTFVSELKKGRYSKVSKPVNDISYIDICTAAEEGDDLAREVLTGSAVILGTGLANFINLLNPGMIILSGPLVKHSRLFYRVCTEVAAKKCYINNRDRVSFNKGGHFEDYAISVGSAAMTLEHCLDSKTIK